MKKFFKILGITVLVLLVIIIVAPFFLKDQIAQVVKDKLNESMNAQIDFKEVDLSLFRAFPDARLELKSLSIINKAPFLGDTLFYGSEVKLDLPLADLFNDADEPIRINELILTNAVVHLKSNLEGKTNWDIAKADPKTVEDETTAGFNVNLKYYEIKNSTFSYEDEATKNVLQFAGFNHKGTGDLSLTKSTLKTYTESKVKYSLDGVEYLSGQLVKLDANLALDLENQKYTFLDNKAFINDLELKMDGFVDLEENSTLVDLTFNTPTSDFKNFFAMIPETYRKNMDGMTTTGDFIVNGTIKGAVTDTTIPKLDIKMSSNNASFKYADLPQKVTDIIIHVFVKNETGIVEDTYINIQDIAFNIAGERIAGRAMVTDLTQNMKVDMNAKGNLDFKNLTNAFPVPKDMNLSGKLGIDMDAKFDMESVEKERYENIVMKGDASLTNFTYKGAAFNNPFFINQAAIAMNASTITLNSFNAKTGNTDLRATGTIINLIGFLLQDKGLKGSFNLDSNVLDTADFMSKTTVEEPAKSNAKKTTVPQEAIKIPAFLDASLNFNADKVLYDGITLNNVKGVATIQDEQMSFKNTSTSVFGGTIGVNGFVNTKNAQPIFDMALDMKNLDIAQSFQGFDMFKKLVPIISIMQGKITTDVHLAGALNNDFTPVLNSVVGDAFAQLLTKKINTANSPLLARLDEKLSFISVDDIDISNITTNLDFKDGAVKVSPFDFNVKDMKVTASGSHSLTNDMNYTLNFSVPAKYLGREASSLLSKLSETDIAAMRVPVPVQISGTISKPVVNVNMQGVITNLTNQIIELQKAKFINQGQDAVNNAINNVLGGKNPVQGVKDAISGNRGNQPGATSTSRPVDSAAIKRKRDSAIQAARQKAKDEARKAASGTLNNLIKKKN